MVASSLRLEFGLLNPASPLLPSTNTLARRKSPLMAQHTLLTDGKFRYIDSGGDGPTLMLLHGLFGALSNFAGIISAFGTNYRVIVPMLPVYELSILNTGLGGLLDHVTEFVEHLKLRDINLLGNSLGGHVAQLYTLRAPERVRSLTLTGSSGLFESAFGSGFPKRGDREYITKKIGDVFYDPATATEELIDEVFEITTNREKALKVVMTAKSAVRHNLESRLKDIHQPVLLVWGRQDTVTPPFVGEKFAELIPNARLVWIDKCGHAPMMEHPDRFNEILLSFLGEVNGVAA